jgi:RNA polymerase sigma-70 factor, ECF subfamily
VDRLLRIAQFRDAKAFQEIYDMYAGRIRAFMRKRGVDPTIADELAQETFAAVWRKAASYDPARGDEAGWVYTIARNLYIDQVRRQRVWQDYAQRTQSDPDEPECESAFDTLSAAERAGRVNAAVASLPLEQAEVIRLAFVEGLAHGDIATRLALPIGTVKSRIRLAYGRLRDRLEDLQ